LTTYPHLKPKLKKEQRYSSTLLLDLNPINAELNPICHLLALFGAHHILHVSRIRVISHLISADIIRSSPYSPR